MNEMRVPTQRSLSFCLGLAWSAIAACSGMGQDRVITVGVRPNDRVAASSGKSAGDAERLPPSESDVTEQTVVGNSTTTRGVLPIGKSDAFAGSFASAGSRATAEGRIDAGSAGLPAARDASAAGEGGARSPRSATEDECGVIPAQPAGNVAPVRMGGAGLIEYDVNSPNVFTGLRTTVAVPAEPPPTGQVFIWPGIQPTLNATNFQPINNGALMSVLAWGPLCAAGAPTNFSTWWIAPLYSNISTSDPEYAGCPSGKVLMAKPKQLLDIDMHLEGTLWIEHVVNRDTLEVSDFTLDLKGQEQGRTIFDIQLPSNNRPTEDVIFTNTVLFMERSDPSACEPVLRGMNDFASKPRVSGDGKHCCIDRIVLRAPRVMATTSDPP